LHVVAALLKAREGALSNVLLQELHGLLVQLRGRSGPLLRGQRFSLVGLVYVALLTEERLTQKVRAAWALDMPPPTAETILLLRSSE
jgi:hypothetical protein